MSLAGLGPKSMPPGSRFGSRRLWHDGWHPFLWVWMPVRESLCLFWRETHPKGLCLRSPTRPDVDEGRNIRERTEGDSQKKGAAETSRLNRSVKRWVREKGDQSTEVRYATAKTCWPTDAGLTNARRWVSIPSGLWKFRADTRPQ